MICTQLQSVSVYIQSAHIWLLNLKRANTYVYTVGIPNNVASESVHE